MILSSNVIRAQSSSQTNSTVEIVNSYIVNTQGDIVKYKGRNVSYTKSMFNVVFNINVNSPVKLKPSLWVPNATYNNKMSWSNQWQSITISPPYPPLTKNDMQYLEKIYEFPEMTVNQSGTFSLDWDGFSNINGTRKPVRDMVAVILENVDTGELLFAGETIPFSAVSRYSSDMNLEFTANEKSISANVFFISDLPAKNAGVIIVQSHCDIYNLLVDASNRGVKGIVDYLEKRNPTNVVAYKEFGPVTGGGVINDFSWENIQDIKGNIWVPEFEYRPSSSDGITIDGYYFWNYECIFVVEGENEAINKGFNEGQIRYGAYHIPLPSGNNRESNTGAPYNVEVPGTLAALLGDKIDTITILSLSGSINGYDIETIRKMKKLSVLDMSRVDIVEGGDPYSDYYTYADRIPDFAFVDLLNNSSIATSIVIPNNVYYLGGNVFNMCYYNLNSIALGINTMSFEMPHNLPFFPSLKEYVVPEKNIAYSSEDGVLFNKNKTILVSYPANKSGDSYTIPNSVATINGYSFCASDGLKSVTIPVSVTSIEGPAFIACKNLNEIYCYNNVPPIVTALYGVSYTPNASCKLYIPKGSKAAYAAAEGWKQFTNIIEMSETSIDIISKDNVSIQTVPTGIVVESNETIPVFIYSVSGQKVYESSIQGNKQISLNKGIYIVKAGETIRKIAVNE